MEFTELAESSKNIKTLFLLRHAKAESLVLKKTDHDRELIEKGKKHAEKMASLVKTFRFRPEVIYTSSAVRARDTALIFSETLGIQKKLKIEDSLYSGTQQGYLNVVQNLPDTLESAMLVGHNPTLEDLIVSLTARTPFQCKLSTCGLAIIHFQISLWSEVRPATGTLRVMLYPKLFSE